MNASILWILVPLAIALALQMWRAFKAAKRPGPATLNDWRDFE